MNTVFTNAVNEEEQIMSKGYYHPKKQPRGQCAFCKRWNGDAEVAFKNPQAGFEFKLGKFGTCMVFGSTQPSTGGSGCKSYEPSVEASRLL